MGALKKFLWSLMTIVLILMASFLVAISLVDDYTRQFLLEKIEIQTYRYVILLVGVSLFVFAVILLVDIIANQHDKREYLLQSEDGDIYITKTSLDSTVKNSVNKFINARLTDCNVKVSNNSEINANLKCDIYEDVNFEQLGKKIQAEVEASLRKLTGNESVKVNIQLNKANLDDKKELK